MATYEFKLTRDQIITGALRLLGVVGQGQTPDATQISDGAEALNVLTKAWMADGLPAWAIKEVTLTPVSGTTSYTVGDGLNVNTQEPLRIYQMWYRNTTSNIDVPMVPLTEQQYESLTNKSQVGTSIQYFYKRLNGSGVINLYLTPDSTFAANNVIHFLMKRPYADFDASTDYPDFPQEWIRALKYGLADEMSMEYGLPTKDRQELMLRAEKYKEDAMGSMPEEGSLLFQPDNTRKGR